MPSCGTPRVDHNREQFIPVGTLISQNSKVYRYNNDTVQLKLRGMTTDEYLNLFVVGSLLRFSPLLKNQHFQIPIRPRIRWSKNHYVDVLPANRYLFYLFIYLFLFIISYTLL